MDKTRVEVINLEGSKSFYVSNRSLIRFYFDQGYKPIEVSLNIDDYVRVSSWGRLKLYPEAANAIKVLPENI